MKTRRALAVVVVVGIVAALAMIVPIRVDAPAPDAARSSDVIDSAVVLARVSVVGIDGQPIAGMMPIATQEANAFDVPVAQGDATGADGKSVLRLPPNRYLYVRAWDPELNYFANNFFDVPESPGGSETEPMRIVMARAAVLTATIVGEDSVPLGGLDVEIMMEHPERGPWWPGRGRTQEDGGLVVVSIPPGMYRVNLSAGDYTTTTLEGITISPGTTANLGVITLSPQ